MYVSGDPKDVDFGPLVTPACSILEGMFDLVDHFFGGVVKFVLKSFPPNLYFDFLFLFPMATARHIIIYYRCYYEIVIRGLR